MVLHRINNNMAFSLSLFKVQGRVTILILRLLRFSFIKKNMLVIGSPTTLLNFSFLEPQFYSKSIFHYFVMFTWFIITKNVKKGTQTCLKQTGLFPFHKHPLIPKLNKNNFTHSCLHAEPLRWEVSDPCCKAMYKILTDMWWVLYSHHFNMLSIQFLLCACLVSLIMQLFFFYKWVLTYM